MSAGNKNEKRAARTIQARLGLPYQKSLLLLRRWMEQHPGAPRDEAVAALLDGEQTS